MPTNSKSITSRMSSQASPWPHHNISFILALTKAKLETISFNQPGIMLSIRYLDESLTDEAPKKQIERVPSSLIFIITTFAIREIFTIVFVASCTFG